MCVFRYNQDQKTNLLNFQKDLYIYFNTKLDSDEQIIKYTNDFVTYFNHINIMVKNFKNDIEDLTYEYEFEIAFNISNDNPSISLKRLHVIYSNDFDKNSGKTNNRVKHLDYMKIVNLLDYNYSIFVNTFPYYIISIIRTNDYVQYNDFYNGQFILLKNNNLTKQIEINFDNGIIYFYCLDKEISEYEFDDYDQFNFRFFQNKLIVINGPIIVLTITESQDKILLDEELYLIDSESSVNIFSLIN